MKHIWTVLCQNSIIDSENNNISIYNVLEQLVISVDEKNTKTDQAISIPINYEVVSLWIKNDNKNTKADILLEIIDPKGKILKTFTQKGELPTSMTRLRTRIRIQGIGLTISGMYNFIIKLKTDSDSDYHKVTEVPLEVHINSSKKYNLN